MYVKHFCSAWIWSVRSPCLWLPICANRICNNCQISYNINGFHLYIHTHFMCTSYGHMNIYVRVYIYAYMCICMCFC